MKYIIAAILATACFSAVAATEKAVPEGALNNPKIYSIIKQKADEKDLSIKADRETVAKIKSNLSGVKVKYIVDKNDRNDFVLILDEKKKVVLPEPPKPVVIEKPTPKKVITKKVKEPKVTVRVSNSAKEQALASKDKKDKKLVISVLVRNAEENIKNNRLTRPNNNNAMKNIRELEELGYNTDNLRDSVASRYIALAGSKYRGGDNNKGDTYIAKAIEIYPRSRISAEKTKEKYRKIGAARPTPKTEKKVVEQRGDKVRINIGAGVEKGVDTVKDVGSSVWGGITGLFKSNDSDKQN